MPRPVAVHAERALTLSAFTAGVAVALLVAVGLYIRSQPDPFDPLGEFPVQTVESRVPDVEGPAVTVGGVLVVSGTKCNRTGEPVPVRGGYSWVLNEPRGTIVAGGEGTGERDPGCQSFRFENPMPDAVAERAAEVGPTSVWHLSGYDIPLDADGNEGQRVNWQTENFTIVTGR